MELDIMSMSDEDMTNHKKAAVEQFWKPLEETVDSLTKEQTQFVKHRLCVTKVRDILRTASLDQTTFIVAILADDVNRLSRQLDQSLKMVELLTAGVSLAKEMGQDG